MNKMKWKYLVSVKRWIGELRRSIRAEEMAQRFSLFATKRWDNGISFWMGFYYERYYEPISVFPFRFWGALIQTEDEIEKVETTNPTRYQMLLVDSKVVQNVCFASIKNGLRKKCGRGGRAKRMEGTKVSSYQ